MQPTTMVTETEDVERFPTEPIEGFKAQDEAVRVLGQTAEPAECQPSPRVVPENSGNPSDEAISTQTWLLDRLMKQLGAWENEILRQREAQQRQQRRLDARQEELDRLAVELTEQREQLQQGQVEVEGDEPAAISNEPATCLPLERALPSLPENAVGSAGSVSTEAEAERTRRNGPSRAEGPALAQDSTGLSTARLFAGRSAATGSSTANDQPSSPSPSPAVELSERADRRSPMSEAPTEPEIQESVSSDDDGDTSIQDYLKSLLDREKQGHSHQKPSVTPASLPPSKKPRGLSPETAPKDSSLQCEPIILPPRVARRPAPKIDLSAQMPALRDVANDSASSALRHYSQRRLSRWIQLIFIGAAACLVAGGLALWFSTTLALSILAGGLLAAGIAFLGMQILTGRHSRRGPAEHRQDTSSDAESSDA